MATGRAYRIKKNAVKAYGYTSPPKKRLGRNGPRFAANGSVTHIAAINGRGSYRSARRTMSGLSANRRPAAARSSLSSAKKAAFARKMRAAKAHKKNSRNSTAALYARPRQKPRPKLGPRGGTGGKRAWRKGGGPVRHVSFVGGKRRVKKYKSYGAAQRARSLETTKSRRRVKAAKKATRKTTMARRKVRRKKSAARKPVARKRRVKRASKRRVSKRKAAPKRRKRRAKKVTLKANRRRSRRRLKRNYGTSAGARKGWRTRKAKRRTAKAGPKRKRRRSRKASAVAPKRRRRSAKRRTSRKGKRKLSMKKSAVAARRRRRALAKGGAPKRRRRKSRRKMSANRRRRSHRRMRANPRRRRSRARMSSNRRRRRGSRRHASNRRRHRRNGRRLFKKNGIGDTLLFIAKTGGLALTGFVGHKLFTNLLVNNVFSKIFGAPAVVVATSPTTAAVVAPATSGLGLINLDPQYQKVGASLLVAGLGIFASAKLIKDPGTRNTVMTGIAVSFTHTLLAAVLDKVAPQYSGMLNGDGTAARLSAMYGLGAGTSLQPRYSSIGRGMNGLGEYFDSGVSGLGEYFSSGMNGLGEYFDSGVSGLGLPAYEAAAGYGANPDFAEAAAGMGAREAMNTNHVDPHGDLDRELTIAEAAAGVGALPSYEAAAGFGAISTLPTASTWIPGSANGQIWAGTRSISAPQSATEMVPAGVLQTDGGQGVFG